MIFVFDRTSRKSFDNIPQWAQEVSEYTNEKVIKVLAGNKNDCDCLITDSEGYAKANSLNMKYFSVSAKTGSGVVQLFDFITRELIEKCTENDKNFNGVKLENQVYAKSWCC